MKPKGKTVFERIADLEYRVKYLETLTSSLKEQSIKDKIDEEKKLLKETYYIFSANRKDSSLGLYLLEIDGDDDSFVNSEWSNQSEDAFTLDSISRAKRICKQLKSPNKYHKKPEVLSWMI